MANSVSLMFAVHLGLPVTVSWYSLACSHTFKVTAPSLVLLVKHVVSCDRYRVDLSFPDVNGSESDLKL